MPKRTTTVFDPDVHWHKSDKQIQYEAGLAESYSQWFGDKPVSEFLLYWNENAEHLGDYCEDMLRGSYDSIAGELEEPIPDEELSAMADDITAYVRLELEHPT